MELVQKNSFAFGINNLISGLVAGGAMMMVGIYVYTKIRGSISQAGFTTAENTAMTNVKTNITSGFDLGSIVFIVIAATVVLGALYLMIRV